MTIPVSLSTSAGGLGLYLLLCAVAVLTGRGLLRLLHCQVEPRARLALAPLLALLFWTLARGVLGATPMLVRAAAPWLWAATLLLALSGLRGLWADLRRGG